MENEIINETAECKCWSKSIFIWIVVVLIVGTGGYIGYKAYYKSKEVKKGKYGIPQDPAIAVGVAEPKIMPVRDVRNFTGSLKPWSTYDLAPKVGGRLEKLTVTIGDPVKKGTLIAKIDDVEYQQSLAQAKAETEIAKAYLAQTNVNLMLKQKEFDRKKILMKKKAVAKAAYETSESALQAQMALHKMKQAELLHKKTAQKIAELKLSYTTLNANWDDKDARFVGQRYVDPGTLLAANQPVVSVINISRMKASIHVIERDYPLLKIGQTADIITDAFPGKVFKSKIIKISKLLQVHSRQAEVLLEIPNKDLKLKPGMFVRVQIEFGRNDKAVTIPRNALLFRGGKQGVFRLSAELGKAFFTPVKTGIVTGDLVEILEPKITCPVITLGNHMLASGMPVLPPAKYRSQLKPDKKSASGKHPETKGVKK